MTPPARCSCGAPGLLFFCLPACRPRDHLFLADLHLSPDTPALNARFQAFLRAHAGQVEALYILGDLFEFWLGDDDDRPFTRDCLSWLAAFARQTPLYVLPGNRDFYWAPVLPRQRRHAAERAARADAVWPAVSAMPWRRAVP